MPFGSIASAPRHFLHVAVAVVRVHQNRQRRRSDDLPDSVPLLAVMGQVKVGECVPCAVQREAADLIGLETSTLNELRCQRIVSGREEKRGFSINKLFPGLVLRFRHP